MNKERLQFQGRLALRKKEAKELEIKARGLLESVRLHLDPLEKIEELEIDIAFQQMAELAKTWARYKETLAEIKAANKALGRE